MAIDATRYKLDNPNNINLLEVLRVPKVRGYYKEV